MVESPGGRDGCRDPDGEAEHRLGMLLRSAYFALRRCSNAHAARLGANGDQFVLLRLLAEEDGVTQQDLVLRSGYDATTTGTMLRLMEQRQLVFRSPCPDDGRAKRVRLTDEGRVLHDRLWANAEPLRRGLADCVPEAERAVLEQQLQRMASAMERVRAAYESDENP